MLRGPRARLHPQALNRLSGLPWPSELQACEYVCYILRMPTAASKEPARREHDILKLIPPPSAPPQLTARRIGIHTSTAGGVEKCRRTRLPARMQHVSDILVESAAVEALRTLARPVRGDGPFARQIRSAPAHRSTPTISSMLRAATPSFSASRLRHFVPRSSVALRCAPSTWCCIQDHSGARIGKKA